MPRKRLSFINVNPFPLLFYTGGNQLNGELIEKILESGAIRAKVSMRVFLKFITKIADQKFASPKMSRIEFIIQNLPELDFRKKWYLKSEKRQKKFDLKPFYEYSCYYVIQNYEDLDFKVGEMSACFWSMQSKQKGSYGQSFFTEDGFYDFIKMSSDKDIPREMLALYVWSFWESHVWYDIGGNKDEGAEPFLAQLHDFLNQSDTEDILHLCLPPDSPEETISSDKKETDIRQKEIQVKPDSETLEIDYSRKDWKTIKPNLLSNNSPAELLEYTEILIEIYELKGKLAKDVEEDNYSEISKISKKLEKKEALFDEYTNRLQSWFNSQGYNRSLIPPPKNLKKDWSVAEKYVVDIDKIIQDQKKQVEQSIEASKEKLRKKFKDADLEIPKDIEEAKSIESLRRIYERWSPKIKVSLILKHCIAHDIQKSEVNKLDSNLRLDIYDQLSVLIKNYPKLFRIFNFILKDPEAFQTDVQKGKDIIFAYIEILALEKLPLPEGTWSFVNELGFDNIFSEIIEKGYLDRVQEVQPTDLVALSNMAGDNLEVLPEKLSNIIKLNRLRKIEPEERINKILELFKDKLESEHAAQMLFNTLCEVNRYNEAIYLVSVFSKINPDAFSSDEIHEPLLILMLQSASRADYDNSILSDLLDDFEWLIQRDQDIVALLYILYKAEIENIYVNLKYQAADQIELARKQYPFLVDYLIRANENDYEHESALLDEKLQIVKKGRKNLKIFEDNLKKHSCYPSWLPAAKYQDHFRSALDKVFSKIKKGNRMPKLKADDMIYEAHKSGLPQAKGVALTNMKRHLEKQIERLDIIYNAFQSAGFEAFQNESFDNFSKIEKERDSIKLDRITNFVYEAALEDLS